MYKLILTLVRFFVCLKIFWLSSVRIITAPQKQLILLFTSGDFYETTSCKFTVKYLEIQLLNSIYEIRKGKLVNHYGRKSIFFLIKNIKMIAHNKIFILMLIFAPFLTLNLSNRI